MHAVSDHIAENAADFHFEHSRPHLAASPLTGRELVMKDGKDSSVICSLFDPNNHLLQYWTFRNNFVSA